MSYAIAPVANLYRKPFKLKYGFYLPANTPPVSNSISIVPDLREAGHIFFPVLGKNEKDQAVLYISRTCGNAYGLIEICDFLFKFDIYVHIYPSLVFTLKILKFG